MAWQDTLLDASFKGVKFDCARIQDEAQRDVQRHQYPYVNGEDTEDLGRTAVTSELTAVFWGDDYEQRYQKFLEVLEQPGPGELIHPIFGSIPLAQLEAWRVGHDADTPDACTVDLRFVHSTPSSPLFTRQLPEQKAAASRQLKEDGLASGVESFAKRLKALTSLKGVTDRLNSIRSTMDRTLSAIRSVTNGVGAVTDLVEFPRTFTSSLADGLRGLVDLRSFGRSSRMSDWNGLKGVFDDVIRLPVSSAKGETPTSFRPTQAGQVGAQQSQVPIAILQEDQQPIVAVVKVVTAAELVDTASDILTDEAKTPTLSPADIEVIVSDVREVVQDAIDANRDLYPVEEARLITEPLKDAALAIQEAAVVIIEARPPLRQRVVNAPTNLHLLAHQWYGDYRRADELVRLNPAVRNPNDIAAGTTINGYSQ
ncbi:multidrug DMT transporter permease [Achromobacter sp. RW408]|uniref:DNA circularization protein n=1 Tax=Achromobacter sp. RW408 TaxID=2202897 RepID=UPI000D72AE63|nr:DNA circularization N-terminal domain-containing protein [Achromobacter sp. RW408]PWY53681.1 multidrug DMT transporter permease [Achromobacter sp. RW408]